jgi:hypothetical protein
MTLGRVASAIFPNRAQSEALLAEPMRIVSVLEIALREWNRRFLLDRDAFSVLP